jgi:hypothetical protein
MTHGCGRNGRTSAFVTHLGAGGRASTEGGGGWVLPTPTEYSILPGCILKNHDAVFIHFYV